MKRFLLLVAIVTSGCATTAHRALPGKSRTTTAMVVVASVVGIGLVAASGSQGPR